MSFVQDFNKAEGLISEFGKTTLAVYGVDTVIGNSFVTSSDGLVVRNLKRGALWELADEAIEEVTTMNSLMRQQKFMKVLDNVAYSALVSAGAEVTNVFGLIDDAVGSALPGGDLRNSAITAVIIMGSKRMGQQFENSFVKNLSSLFGK